MLAKFRLNSIYQYQPFIEILSRNTPKEQKIDASLFSLSRDIIHANIETSYIFLKCSRWKIHFFFEKSPWSESSLRTLGQYSWFHGPHVQKTKNAFPFGLFIINFSLTNNIPEIIASENAQDTKINTLPLCIMYNAWYCWSRKRDNLFQWRIHGQDSLFLLLSFPTTNFEWNSKFYFETSSILLLLEAVSVDKSRKWSNIY